MDVKKYCQKMGLEEPQIIDLDGFLFDFNNKYWLVHRDEYDEFCDFHRDNIVEMVMDDIEGNIGDDAMDWLKELAISYVKHLIDREGVWVSYEGEGYLYVKI